MSEQDHLKRVWDIVERVGVCMLTTHSDDGLRARPVESRLERAANLIWVVTDLRSGKEREIDTAHAVGLTFADTSAKAYLLDHRARRSAPRSPQSRRNLAVHR